MKKIILNSAIVISVIAFAGCSQKRPAQCIDPVQEAPKPAPVVVAPKPVPVPAPAPAPVVVETPAPAPVYVEPIVDDKTAAVR
jgi:PBP1b-binding outer membrane lipoprotein LpoB